MKKQFPIFQKFPELVYLDNAATTQKPYQVIERINNFNSFENSNVHRGSYPLSEQATEEFENSRNIVAEFIGAKPSEIIFTSGATDSLNLASELIYYNDLLDLKNREPVIAVPEESHHSLILPFRRFFQNQRFYNNINGIKDNTDIALITHVSNVTGKIVDPSLLHAKIKVLDCAQSVAHMKLDVKNLNVDFLTFSAHKMYGPMGTGVLWVREEILNKCNPVRLGGGIVNLVEKESIKFSDGPARFEPGTPNVAGVVGLAEACKFLTTVDLDVQSTKENELKNYLISELKNIDPLEIFTDVSSPVGVVSFAHKKIHAHDIAGFLGAKGICVRAGHHCTDIFHREVLKVPATVRVSLGIYNDNIDVDKLVDNLQQAIKIY